MMDFLFCNAGFPLQAGPLFSQSLLDDFLDRIINLHESGWRLRLRFEWLCAHLTLFSQIVDGSRVFPDRPIPI